MASCRIPYIDNEALSEAEKDRLFSMHNEIFNKARESKAFRVFNDKLYTLKNAYNKATIFIGKTNFEYNAPVTRLQRDNTGSFLYVDVLPLSKERQSSLFFSTNVDYILKSVNILQSKIAEEVFKKGDKNGWNLDKILLELSVPKEQKEFIKSFNTNNREEIIASLLANYSYTIEVNTIQARGVGINVENIDPEDIEYYNNLDKNKPKIYSPSQYYSNLTVPGGTNYTENEIKTPAITPSIKGHAAFSSDSGIGWFRSDEKQNYTEQDVDFLIGNMIKSGILQKNCS